MINVENKGGGLPYARDGLAFIGNAQMADVLPIGQGHGSVFLMTPKLKGNSATRIGASYSGLSIGGLGAGQPALSCGYVGSSQSGGGLGGSGRDGGETADGSFPQRKGGYGTNGYDATGAYFSSPISYGGKGLQGAHLFIVAATIENLSINNISTGGSGSAIPVCENKTGNAGVAGGSGYNGGGGADAGNTGMSGTGGSSGWAFIYANKITSEDTTGVVI
jgi:hypothetical protein